MIIADKGCIAGRGSPEGVIKGEPGSLYLDVAAGVFYYKESGQGSDSVGWVVVTLA